MPRRACALLALACGRLAHADDAWKLLRAYPPHYVALKLAPGEALAIDGRLNDSAWAAVPWISDEPGGAGGFVDITAHADAFLNAVPALMQTRVKVRWDDDFFYVGAELEEPFVYADASIAAFRSDDATPLGEGKGDGWRRGERAGAEAGATPARASARIAASAASESGSVCTRPPR